MLTRDPIEREVMALLARSDTWQAMAPDDQTRIARDMTRVAAALLDAQRSGATASSSSRPPCSWASTASS